MLWRRKPETRSPHGDGPESPATGVSGQRTRNLRSLVFRCRVSCCGASLLLVRSYTGDGPESPARRSLRPKGPGISGPVFFAAKCLLVVRYWTGVRRYPGDGPESPAHRSLRSKGPGISGPRFFQLVCIFVVRYWIGVRNTPGECPESPARPESPALWTGISGLPDDPAGRSLRSLTPESPAWTGSNG